MFQSSGICSNHRFGRCAIHPKFINDSGVFDPEQFFQLIEIKKRNPAKNKVEGTGVYAMSIASEIIANGRDGIHQYGQWAAGFQNERYQETKGHPPDPGSTYIGYFEIDGGDILSFQPQLHQLRVRWEEEHNQTCHFQIEAKISDTGTKAERRNERADFSRHINNVIKNFWELPPEKHLANEAELCKPIRLEYS